MWLVLLIPFLIDVEESHPIAVIDQALDDCWVDASSAARNHGDL